MQQVWICCPQYISITKGAVVGSVLTRLYGEFAYLKQYHPDLWNELEILSKDKNLASQKFKYGNTFSEVDKKIDEFIAKQKI